MKNIALSLCLALVLAACSSGNTASDTPTSTTGLYSGAFISSNGENDGVMILNIVEDDTGTISGTIQFQFDETDLTCFRPGTIEGTVSGFNVALTSVQDGGTLTLQLTFDGNNTLAGTYVAPATPCSDFSGSGSITLTR